MGKFSQWLDDIFLIFPRKQDLLTFHANFLLLQENRFLHFMQSVLSIQFAWNVESYFLGKIRKYFKLSSAELYT